MQGLRARLLAVTGWRRFLIAAVLGGLLALAQAPFFLWPLAFFCVAGLLLLTAEAGRGAGYFLSVFAFAFGHFAAGWYWIGYAFFVDAERFAWLLPLPVLILPAFLGLFPAFGAWVMRRLGPEAEPWRSLLFVAGFTLGDWARHLPFRGFPWNPMGQVWADTAPVMQIAAHIGTWGLGAVTMLLAALLALTVLKPGRASAVAALAAFALFAALGFAGQQRLAQNPTEVFPDIWMRLVQPSVPQTLKWRDDLRQQHLVAHADLTRVEPERPLTHVIWPETAIPYLLDEQPGLRAALARLVPPEGQLIAGGIRREQEQDGTRRVYNSIFALDERGAIVGRYDKAHLVPFGEYLPLRRWLRPLGIDAIAGDGGDFTAGTDTGPMILPGALPLIRPLICYEIVYANEVMDHGLPKAAMMLNLTNDAWFGPSTGPHQHFAAARMRAVEQGVPVVRAANNGITAIIDAYGRVLGRLDLDAVGVLDGPLPVPANAITPYSRFGDWPLLGLCIAAFIGVLLRSQSRSS